MRNNYEYQKAANILCLLEDVEYSERKEAFNIIVSEFQVANVRWGLACSMNLFLRGVVDEFHDFDLIVEYEDIEKVKQIMKHNGGILVDEGGNGYCESVVYLHYQLGRVDVDIISGFKVVTFGTNFQYNFCDKELEFVEVGSLIVPLIPIEALYLLYAMMEGWQAKRRYKRLLIQEYLISKEIRFSLILERALAENQLPSWIKREVRLILSQ